MKKVILIAIVLVNSTIAFSQSIKNIDTDNGFNQMQFETPSYLFPYMKEVNLLSNGDYKSYVKPNDNRIIENCEVNVIRYGYYKNKLYNISFTVSGDNIQYLLSYFKKKYGDCTQSNNENHHYWQGNKVSMSFEIDGDLARVLIFSKVYFKEQQQDLNKT